MNSIVIKVRDGSKVINKTIFLALDHNIKDKKKIWGCGLANTKAAVFG
ncbi:hypothetical protein [Flavobacterium sp. ZS1P14]|jgi:hypothetical protein